MPAVTLACGSTCTHSVVDRQELGKLFGIRKERNRSRAAELSKLTRHLPAVIAIDEGPDLPHKDGAAYSPVQKAWLKATTEVMKNKYDKSDAVDPNFLNHVVWYSATGWARPYPGEPKVEMPGPFVKAAKKYHDEDDQ